MWRHGVLRPSVYLLLSLVTAVEGAFELMRRNWRALSAHSRHARILGRLFASGTELWRAFKDTIWRLMPWQVRPPPHCTPPSGEVAPTEPLLCVRA